jgi:hypothetical protein
MAELSRDVQDRHASGQQQRRERVAHLVRPAPMEAGSIQDAVERFAYVRPVERRARDRREDPLGNGCPNASPVRTLYSSSTACQFRAQRPHDAAHVATSVSLCWL